MLLHELIIEILKKQSISITQSRIDVLAILFSGSQQLMQLQEVLRMSAKKLDRVTAYRTLTFFCEIGIVYKVLDDKNKSFYALDPKLLSFREQRKSLCNEHYHFKCTVCNSITCLPNNYQEIELPDGFIKTNANLLLMGYCPSCSPIKRTDNLKKKVAYIPK